MMFTCLHMLLCSVRLLCMSVGASVRGECGCGVARACASVRMYASVDTGVCVHECWGMSMGACGVGACGVGACAQVCAGCASVLVWCARVRGYRV